VVGLAKCFRCQLLEHSEKICFKATNVLNAVKSVPQSHVLKKMMKSQDVKTVMAIPLQTKEGVSFILKNSSFRIIERINCKENIRNCSIEPGTSYARKPTTFTNLGDLIINHVAVSLTEAISTQISKFIGDL
jgi:hypothetical protein